MYKTSLEKVLAESLTRITGADIPGIIAAAQEACMCGCKTVAEAPVTVVETPAPKAEKAPRTKKEVETVKPVEQPVVETKPAPVAEKPAPVADKPTAGIDLTGLFTGTGADKKVVKDVFLAAVDKAKNLATLVALNATCDCGFATGDYTDNEMEVLRRKLKRWGAAQE